MDDFDKRILKVVQEDAELPSAALAERVHLSPSAVQRRLSRLKKEGVIERTVAIVNPRAAGRLLTVLVEVEIHNEHRHAVEKFQSWISNAGEVQACWYVTGDVDYVMLVAVRDLDGYNGFIDRLISEQSVVRKFKSLIALRTIKRGLNIQVD